MTPNWILPLEVHHIDPLNGASRLWSEKNIPSNLVVLCHDCHVEVHHPLHMVELLKRVTAWEVARLTGQSIMRLEV